MGTNQENERQRIIGLLNEAVWIASNAPWTVDLLNALKACVRNPELRLDKAFQVEQETAKKSRR